MPQCIAHRGYKAKHPENTMAAFRGAVDAGVHAVETDVQITKDDVVVLSHVRLVCVVTSLEEGSLTVQTANEYVGCDSSAMLRP